MKILVVGDTHADAQWMRRVLMRASEQGITVVFQVGDFGYFPNTDWGRAYIHNVSRLAQMYEIDVFFIDGNHDDIASLKKNGSGKVDENLYYVGRGASWQWDGVRFLAFGGAVSIDQEMRMPGATWWADEVPTYTDIAKACDNALALGADVMFTHDAPTGLRWDAPFDAKWDDQCNEMRRTVRVIMDYAKPRVLFHGHYHTCYTDRINDTQIIGLGAENMQCSMFVLDTEEVKDAD